MTKNKKFAKRIYVATACGAVAALISWSLVDANRVVGQTTAANASAAPQAVVPGAATIPAPSATTNAAPVATDNSQTLATIRARINELQASLQTMPTSVEEQNAQQKTIQELSALQSQAMRLESEAANYSAFKQAREAQNASANLNDPYALANPVLNAPNAQDSRQALLDASGLNSGYLNQRFDANALSNGEAALLREQKADLVLQYQQIQQTLRALQPGEEVLAQTLRQELQTIYAQLKDLDAKLASAPATPAPTTPVQQNDPLAGIPEANRLVTPDPNALNVYNEQNARMQKASDAARLLREAGLFKLAGHVDNEVARMSNPNYQETNLVEGSWAASAGQAEEANNPFHIVTPKDIEGLNASINDLKTRVDKLGDALSGIETILKLLTRQQVSGYIPQAEQQAAPAPTTDATLPAPSVATPEPDATPAPAPADANDLAAPIANPESLL
ncbi:MAG: hypothetical protein Q4Q42_00490 [Planctomycetia bacterium]|nr:hypothetical protein [Planctomycetia bacterium]